MDSYAASRLKEPSLARLSAFDFSARVEHCDHKTQLLASANPQRKLTLAISDSGGVGACGMGGRL
jgi:hypothetical protein